MGHKVNPRIFRMFTVNTWPSKWFARRETYAETLRQDVDIRTFLKKETKDAGIATLEIERSPNVVSLTLHAAKPGLIIGRGGQGAEELKKKIQKKFFYRKGVTLHLKIQEVDRPTMNAELVVQQVAADLEKRIPFRRAMKQALSRIQRAGAGGAKILVKGRLNGAEIARSEKSVFGKIPLHTLRANIQYSRGAAHTIYGTVGVKVWVYLGEVFEK